ncbi:prepilin-type N-terminal cleavage/methylation domain-containing protein [Maritimibacter alkaliphilus]|nr:prepilin-type N-terminal cleavage/methylation domain-containing protein [Maritimibacter alkaliphilus]
MEVPGQGQPRDAGLSLLELVIAMALFALVAVTGAQALSGMLRLRDDLVGRADASADAERALALLRADMTSVVPVLFYQPQGGPRSALRGGGNRLEMSTAGRPDLRRDRETGMRILSQEAMLRVTWHVTPDGRLVRGGWRTLSPAAGAELPDVPMMADVRGLTLRSYWPEVGWQRGLQPNGQVARLPGGEADEDRAGGAVDIVSDTLPLAFEVTIETERLGRIVLLETLQ